MTIGQRIAQLRKERGMSQEELGEAMGVSRQAISKWESDAALPEVEKLIALSRLFSIPVGQLLGVEEPAPEQEAQAGADAGEAPGDGPPTWRRRCCGAMSPPGQPRPPSGAGPGWWALYWCCLPWARWRAASALCNPSWAIFSPR